MIKWTLYRKDDPSTWPKIDCPMLVYKCYGENNEVLSICTWCTHFKQFYNKPNGHYYKYDECYYAYIGHVPCGYITHKVLKCEDDIACKIGCSDDGYCMYEICDCEQQREVNEYEIEEKRIWKEFE